MTRRRWLALLAGWILGGAMFWLYHLHMVPFWAPMLTSFAVTFLVLEVTR